MLPQIATIIDSLSLRFSFWSNREEETTDHEEASGRNAHLTQIWLAEIPRCSLNCLYGPSLECGCAHSDFSCICRSIEDIAKDNDVESCLNSCPLNPDQVWTPSRVLDFCELVGEQIELPEYLDQYAGLHRRGAYGLEFARSNSYDPYQTAADYSYTYSYYSTFTEASATDTSVPSETEASATDTSVPSETETAASTTDGTTHTITSAPPTTTGPGSGTSATSTGTSLHTSGLSKGAKAGIGVGVAVGVIVLVAGVLFWYFRRRRANKNNNSSPDAPGGNNIPELSEQTWPKKYSPASGPLVEADSNALHEPDSNSVLPSQQSLAAANSQNPAIYELSGTSSVQPPPAATLAAEKYSESLDQQASTSSNNIPRKAVISSASNPGSETIISGGADTGATSPKSAQEEVALSSSTVGSTDPELSQLEAEMARIADEKRHLQQLQLLEQQEAELKKLIADRKSAISGNSDVVAGNS